MRSLAKNWGTTKDYVAPWHEVISFKQKANLYSYKFFSKRRKNSNYTKPKKRNK